MVDAAWMEQNMPDLAPGYYSEDEVEAHPDGHSTRGLMYRGKWLISPERQERTMRLFWVCLDFSSPSAVPAYSNARLNALFIFTVSKVT